MAWWLVMWGLESLEADPSRNSARFERKEDAITFARQKAKELGREVRATYLKPPGDYPMWRAILGWYPKEAKESVWFRVSPDGRVEPTESPEEFFQRTSRMVRERR